MLTPYNNALLCAIKELLCVQSVLEFPMLAPTKGANLSKDGPFGGSTLAANPIPSRITNELWWLWEQFKSFEPSVQLGGVYANKPGYHNTRSANSSGDYSVQLSVDRLGPSDKAAAIDLTLPDSKMRLYTSRLNAAAIHPDDSRTSHIREFIGTLDSTSVFCRTARGPGTAFTFDGGRDRSHLWHIHISFYRKFVADQTAVAAILSVLKGETFEQWKNRNTQTLEDSEMSGPGMLVKEVDRPEVYLSDGFRRKHLTPAELLRIQAVWKAQGRHYQVVNIPSGEMKNLGDLYDPNSDSDSGTPVVTSEQLTAALLAVFREFFQTPSP